MAPVSSPSLRPSETRDSSARLVLDKKRARVDPRLSILYQTLFSLSIIWETLFTITLSPPEKPRRLVVCRMASRGRSPRRGLGPPLALSASSALAVERVKRVATTARATKIGVQCSPTHIVSSHRKIRYHIFVSFEGPLGPSSLCFSLD